MMRETFLLLMTIMVFCTSCEKNRKIVNTPDGSIAFSIVVEENTRTKTAPVVSEEGISNINIFIQYLLYLQHRFISPYKQTIGLAPSYFFI